jgi:hypothetical protein
MRPYLLRPVLTAVCALALAAAAPAQLVITEVMSSSGVGGTADWFELTNLGGSAVDITGYKMDDGSNLFSSSVALIGVTSIGAGESAVFIESAAPGTDIAAFRTFWGGISGITIGSYTGSGVGLSSSSDGVNLFTGGGSFVTGVSFAVATTGFSFDNHAGASGAISGLSVAGAFGAFTSANVLGNVGSPGAIANAAAVPEPSTYAAVFGALALGGAAWSRRRATAAR